MSLSLVLNLGMLEPREINSSAYAAALGCGVGWGQREWDRVSSFGLFMVEVKSIWHSITIHKEDIIAIIQCLLTG